MPYASAFVKVTHLFAIPATDEVSQFGVNCPADNPAAAVAIVTALDDADLDNLIIAARDLTTDSDYLTVADYARHTGVKVAAIGTDGDYLAEPAVRELAVPGEGTGAQIPPQLTQVVSWWSGQNLGKANYGRVYLPYSKLDLTDETPFCTTAGATGLAAEGVAYLNAIEDVLTVAPAIMSTTGITKQIAAVRVGNVVDTQRRRRNRLRETYQTDFVTP